MEVSYAAIALYQNVLPRSPSLARVLLLPIERRLLVVLVDSKVVGRPRTAFLVKDNA